MDNIRIFIWQASIDHLQYYTWMALRSIMQVPVTFILGDLENEVRKAQNWKQVDLTVLDPIVLPPDKLWIEGMKFLRENPDAIHVFQAFRGAEGYNYFPLILFALRRAIKIVVLDEAYSTRPVGLFYDEQPLLAHIKTWIRPILRRSIATAIKAAAGSHKPCIMPLSLIAERQFIDVGFDSDTLFPFGYFVPKQPVESNENFSSDALRLIFVGALIYRKGLDLLVKAVRDLHEQGYQITLDIYGSGDARKYNLVGIPITYKGILPFDQIQAAIAEHDVLILPSRHDGWGVVVNEALLQGVPVIVSSQIGAKCLVEHTGAGLVFESENPSDLERKIISLIEMPKLLNGLKENARKVGDVFLPEQAARYFLDSLLFHFYKIGVRPSAIWSHELVDG